MTDLQVPVSQQNIGRILSTDGTPTDKNFVYRMSMWRGKKTHSSDLPCSILDVYRHFKGKKSNGIFLRESVSVQANRCSLRTYTKGNWVACISGDYSSQPDIINIISH